MYRYSFCYPLVAEIKEAGYTDPAGVLAALRGFPWVDCLREMEGVPDRHLHFSPSVAFEHLTDIKGMAISIVGMPAAYGFYVSYKRHTSKRRLFNRLGIPVHPCVSNLEGQRWEEVERLAALMFARQYDVLEALFS